jgi:hypothetical protein
MRIRIRRLFHACSFCFTVKGDSDLFNCIAVTLYGGICFNIVIRSIAIKKRLTVE